MPNSARRSTPSLLLPSLTPSHSSPRALPHSPTPTIASEEPVQSHDHPPQATNALVNIAMAFHLHNWRYSPSTRYAGSATLYPQTLSPRSDLLKRQSFLLQHRIVDSIGTAGCGDEDTSSSVSSIASTHHAHERHRHNSSRGGELTAAVGVDTTPSVGVCADRHSEPSPILHALGQVKRAKHSHSDTTLLDHDHDHGGNPDLQPLSLLSIFPRFLILPPSPSKSAHCQPSIPVSPVPLTLTPSSSPLDHHGTAAPPIARSIPSTSQGIVPCPASHTANLSPLQPLDHSGNDSNKNDHLNTGSHPPQSLILTTPRHPHSLYTVLFPTSIYSSGTKLYQGILQTALHPPFGVDLKHLSLATRIARTHKKGVLVVSMHAKPSLLFPCGRRTCCSQGSDGNDHRTRASLTAPTLPTPSCLQSTPSHNTAAPSPFDTVDEDIDFILGGLSTTTPISTPSGEHQHAKCSLTNPSSSFPLPPTISPYNCVLPRTPYPYPFQPHHIVSSIHHGYVYIQTETRFVRYSNRNAITPVKE